MRTDGKRSRSAAAPDGRLASRAWARGVAASYSYTNGSSLAAINYSDNTPDVAFAYDRLGRMTSAITDAVSSNAYAYSLQGLLTNETVSLCASAPLREILSRSHDAFGRPTGISLGDSYRVSYSYDTLGRLSSVSNAAFAAAYTYLPGGFDAGWTITLTNGTIVSRMVTRDSFRGLVTAVSNAVNGAPVSALAYTYDALGRVVSRNADTFGYNPRSEVTSAVIGTNGYGYGYDGIGNALWSTNNGVGTAYLTNPLNQYTNILRASAPPREISPTYDLDGNMITNGVRSYAWDGENRLIAAYSNSTLVISNAYDHMSRRVLKVTPTATHTFLYDGWNLIQETIHNQQSTITNHYVWGKDLSGSFQGAGGVGGLLAVSIGGVWHFPLFDNNGNVAAYAGESGNLAAEYVYDAFGRTITASGPMVDVFRHRFSTKYFDAESRLYYYGYRFYSPELMRWLNRDPIEEVGSYNLYAFVDNNLYSYIDWLGLFSHSHCCSTEQLNFIKLAESSAKKGIREAQDILASMDDAFSTAQIYQNINFLKPIYAFENSIAPLSDSDAFELRSFVYTLLLNTHAMSVMLRDNKYGVECENRCSEYQGDTTHAYVRKNLVLMGIDDDLHFCPSYFKQSDSMRAKLLLHELSHWPDCVNSSDHYASYMDWRTLPWDAAYLQELAVNPQEAIRAVLRMNWKKQKK